VHRYFPDRESLIEAAIEESIQAIQQSVAEAALYRAPDGVVPPSDPVLDLIKRGQAEGAFDPDVSASWIQHVLWVLVYRGCEDADSGEFPRHGITATVIRTLENGIHAR
jgi:AcrR family transcriptional regulator